MSVSAKKLPDVASAEGTVNAITAGFFPRIKVLTHGMRLSVIALGTNTATAVTFTPNPDKIEPLPVVKGSNDPLAKGDIGGKGYWMDLRFDVTINKWILINPALSLTYVNVIHYGAVGDGVADDTTALQNALNSGRIIWLETNKVYKVTKRLKVPSNGGIISDKSGKIYAPAASFNNASLTNRYADNSAVIDCSGQLASPFTANKGCVLKDFIIESEVSDGRLVDGIVGRNIRDTTIDGVEIHGFPVGVGIRLSSCGRNVIIQNCYIHNFTSNVDWGVGTTPQITGIEIDDVRINNVFSVGVRITNNTIQSLTVGDVFYAAHNYQTDGINMVGFETKNYIILGNTIDTVGEGIDTFSDRGSIIANNIFSAHLYGIKLVHGAARNTIANNNIYTAGIAGIVLAGSNLDTVTNDTEYNVVADNNIYGIGAYSLSGSNSCIQVLASTVRQVTNNIFTGNLLDTRPTGKFVISVEAGCTNNNFKENMIIAKGSMGYIHKTEATGSIKDINPTAVKAYANTNQELPGTATKVAFDSVLNDSRGEFVTASNRWVCQIPGIYNVNAMVRFGDYSPNTTFIMAIHKNGSMVVKEMIKMAETNDVSATVTGLLSCAEGDYIEIFNTHNDSFPRAITGGGDYSAFDIFQV